MIVGLSTYVVINLYLLKYYTLITTEIKSFILKIIIYNSQCSTATIGS